MKAYELQPKEGFSSLTLVDRPSPPLGKGEVRVRMRAASLNYRDLFVIRGAKNRVRPVVPLSDGAGEVLAVGEGVTRVAVGDRVAANFFPTWYDGPFAEEHHQNALGGSVEGVLAEEVVLPERAWVRLPREWSFEQGATLPCAALTAYHALFVAGTVTPGETVLVQGSGGVSVFALAFARAAGAKVIATSRSADKARRLRELGAAQVLDYVATPAWGEAARAANGGRGVDLVVEVGGAGTFDESARALRFGGTMSLIGVLTGTQGAVDTHAILHKNLRVHGVYVGSVAMFEAMVRAIEVNGIQPVVDQTFAFGEAAAAYERLASGAHFGKIVVRID